MTEARAETIANILIGTAAVGAAYYVLRKPALRRSALRMARKAIAAAGPWLVAEATQAWSESSGHRGPRPGREGVGSRAI